MIYLFLTSGLFLGWSLGANDAANIFGTAVGTRMIKFKLAAIIASVFVILGAYISGAGASHTLGELGAINKMAGSFTVAFAAALTVTVMTRLKLPVSTSQAVVGAIIGWNLFSGSPTDMGSLTKIVLTWILCPILAAVFSAGLYKLTQFFLRKVNIHLLSMDAYNRAALILVGAFGAYSLGANNIANVMGVFIHSAPFRDLSIQGLFSVSAVQQLFLIGGISIAIGIYTYSKKVMNTVGKDLFRLSPVTAFIVVLSHSIVLYLFASEGLRNWLIARNLPPIPLVPVSSSQAVIGAILGIALVKGGKNIRFGVLGRISSGWITTPVIACLVSIIMLFVMKNVFDQQVYRKNVYLINEKVVEKLAAHDFEDSQLKELNFEMEFQKSRYLVKYLEDIGIIDESKIDLIRYYSLTNPVRISRAYLSQLNPSDFTAGQWQALNKLTDYEFMYKWELYNELADLSDDWKLRSDETYRQYNEGISTKIDFLVEFFRIQP